MLTDCSTTPRETYYACPHCLTKVEVVAGDSKLDEVSIKTSGSPVEKTPSECAHRFGYLKKLPKEAAVPDECLTCSTLLQCFAKRKNIAVEVK